MECQHGTKAKNFCEACDAVIGSRESSPPFEFPWCGRSAPAGVLVVLPGGQLRISVQDDFYDGELSSEDTLLLWRALGRALGKD